MAGLPYYFGADVHKHTHADGVPVLNNSQILKVRKSSGPLTVGCKELLLSKIHITMQSNKERNAPQDRIFAGLNT